MTERQQVVTGWKQVNRKSGKESVQKMASEGEVLRQGERIITLVAALAAFVMSVLCTYVAYAVWFHPQEGSDLVIQGAFGLFAAESALFFLILGIAAVVKATE